MHPQNFAEAKISQPKLKKFKLRKIKRIFFSSVFFLLLEFFYLKNFCFGAKFCRVPEILTLCHRVTAVVKQFAKRRRGVRAARLLPVGGVQRLVEEKAEGGQRIGPRGGQKGGNL